MILLTKRLDNTLAENKRHEGYTETKKIQMAYDGLYCCLSNQTNPSPKWNQIHPKQAVPSYFLKNI